MKAIVGLMPLWDKEKESLWMLPGYMNGIEKAGGIPVILPLTDDENNLERLIQTCDAFLFTGGQDVSPQIYGEKTLDGTDCCKERDAMEIFVLKRALELDKPVLGICRGIQIINACLGGTLFQDLPTQHPSGIEHHQKPPYDKPSHEVQIIEGSALERLLKTKLLPVNSYHHQAIKDLAPGLFPMAISPDGIIEAVHSPDKRFLWAFQWHPEFSYRSDKNSMLIFRAFVDSINKIPDRQ